MSSTKDIVADNLRAAWPYPKDMSDAEVVEAAHQHFQKLDAPTRHFVLQKMIEKSSDGYGIISRRCNRF